jgi:hypothetical protein
VRVFFSTSRNAKGEVVKRKALALTLITMLLSLTLVGVQFINKTKAETLGPVVIVPTSNKVEIFYPQNETYNVNSLLVNFTVVMQGNAFDFGYSLDEGAVIRVENITKISESGWIPYVTYTFRGSVFLANLSEGSHSITVYEGCQFQGIPTNPSLKRYEVLAYDYTNFTIDTIAPNISLLSPENRVYNMSDLSLNFTVNEPVSKFAYSLDGQDNVTISGNTTLTDLPYGEHNVTVFATDGVGNTGTSETIFFSIPEPPEPFPTSLVAASIITVIIVGIGLFVYFKKRKH